MIDFKSKDSEHLAELIAAAGHWCRLHDNVLVCSNEVAVQAIIDAYTLDQAKAFKSGAVGQHATALRNRIVSGKSPGELASWSIKMAEAKKFSQGALESECPMLSLEATSRGITMAALVAKVDGNATGFSNLESRIGGNEGKHKDAIKLLTTFAEVAAYDFSTGWPI